ncbi:hypothetical protein DFH07DRAFT_770169 [Mycena maculata]|uniref:Uncharacterized protein n=1 Tax=Mycena maculata TaxID=230809 RepID=A0AAD7NKE7_9AGAR|nr:hypothetical protein DFH07DRAFT_770169 [Mycena maculata]
MVRAAPKKNARQLQLGLEFILDSIELATDLLMKTPASMPCLLLVFPSRNYTIAVAPSMDAISAASTDKYNGSLDEDPERIAHHVLGIPNPGWMRVPGGARRALVWYSYIKEQDQDLLRG